MAVSDKITASMRRRLYFVIFAIMIACMVFVAFSMYKVAVKESKKYQELANSQQFRATTVKANRGTIYDQNGQVLAQSVTVYTVFVDPRTFAERDMGKESTMYREVVGRDPEEYKIDREEYIVSTLSEALNIAPEDIRQKLYKNNAYQEIAKEVDKAAATKIVKAMSEAGITSVGATPIAKRYYPQNDLAANVIGHLHYDGYGIYGLEAYYDDYLTGTDGRIVSARDATGAEFQYKYKQSYDARDGDSIYTNLDATIQYYCEKALESAVLQNNPKDRACAIVMNAKTGAIYAMATEPDYNLNAPAEIYDTQQAAILAGLEGLGNEQEYLNQRSAFWNKQWKNKAISELYFPGSVFKVVTGSAAIEENAISLNDKFYCNGAVTVDGVPFHCWTTNGGHGTQNFVEAMTHSCNPAFVAIGQKLGAKNFSRYFEAFGLTEKTGIDLPAETSSLFASYAQMTPVTLASSSFGQTNKITPIQMICAYAAVVNGGNLVTPYVVDKIVDCDGNIVKEFTPTIKRQVISEETSAIMRDTLESVVTVNSRSNVYINGYNIGGKSGTSQKLDENPNGDTYVSSYCAFYPANDPEIIMLVMVDEPRNGLYYGSAVAAPVVSEVFTEILPYLGYYAEYTEDELENLEVTVPDVQGAQIGPAMATIESMGLKYNIVGDGETVVKQVPLRGTEMPKGCTVILYTEEDYEEDMVTVPDLTGYSLEKANKKLASIGLNLRPLGGAAHKAGAECSGGMNYVNVEVPKGTVIEAYFLVNDETG